MYTGKHLEITQRRMEAESGTVQAIELTDTLKAIALLPDDSIVILPYLNCPTFADYIQILRSGLNQCSTCDSLYFMGGWVRFKW